MFITGNEGKVKEVTQYMKSFGYIVTQQNLGYPELQAETLEEVVEYGLNHLHDKVRESFIIEDAGLFINGLQGFPGVYSKYVYYTIGLDGILQLCETLQEKKRQAVFRSVYGYRDINGQIHLFKGECPGSITKEKHGCHGFGYDPIFVPTGASKTFAEMSTEEKNQYSHRGKALQKLCNFLEKKEKNKKK